MIQYRFRDQELHRRALTHRSAAERHNERLEFLGDSILNFIIAEAVYERRPRAPEGDLSRLRARLVRKETLAEIAREVGLGEALILGSGELKSGGHRRASILADAVEALIGAVYLDGGFEAARQVVLTLYENRLDNLPDAEAIKDPKTRLQEWLQARSLGLPEYELARTEGAEHKRTFYVQCRVADRDLSVEGEGTSRRKAEQAAAQLALASLSGQ